MRSNLKRRVPQPGHKKGAVIAAVSVLILASCADADPEREAHESAASSSATSGASENKDEGPNPTSGNSAPEGANSLQGGQPNTGYGQGGNGRIEVTLGQIGGVCGSNSHGDTVQAFSKTSCEFAAKLYDHAMNAHYEMWSPDPSQVTAVPRARITATSDSTGETFTLTCGLGSDIGAISCRNPSDPTVGVKITNTNHKIGNDLNIG